MTDSTEKTAATERPPLDPEILQQVKDDLRGINSKDERLSDWESDFIKEHKARFKKWGDQTYLSDKQIDIIHKIAERMAIEGEDLGD
jgi:hypothetical protein